MLSDVRTLGISQNEKKVRTDENIELSDQFLKILNIETIDWKNIEIGILVFFRKGFSIPHRSTSLPHSFWFMLTPPPPPLQPIRLILPPPPTYLVYAYHPPTFHPKPSRLGEGAISAE